MKKIVLALAIMAIFIPNCLSQARKGYGLTLPTEDQLKQFPYIPSFALPPGVILPQKKDLSPDMPKVGDQGYQGSCTAWAISYALKTYQEKVQNYWLLTENGVPRYDRTCSPSFVFNVAKRILNNSNCLDGIPFSLGFQVLTDQGTTFWDVFPYQQGNCTNLPTQVMYTAASSNKIAFARSLNFKDLTELKYNLSVGNPIVLGVSLDDFFQSDGFEAHQSGVHYTYIPKSALANYHAMLCVGYDDAIGVFKVLNSWSDDWGNDGYVDIPYTWFPVVVKEAYYVNDAYSYAFIPSATNLQTESANNTVKTSESFTSWFKQGYYHDFKNLRIGLLDLNEKDKTALVQYTDISTDKVINTVQYTLKTPTTFYDRENKVTFTLTAIGKGGRNPLTKAAYFTVKIDNTIDKEFIDKVNNINVFKEQSKLLESIKLQQQRQWQQQQQKN